MKARRPRLLLWLLSLSCILWMAGAAQVGPAAAREIGTGSFPTPAIAAPASPAPIPQANAARIAFKVVAATRLTIATVPSVPTPADIVHPKATSPVLRLTPYTPVVTGGNQSFDAGTLAGLAIKFLIVIGLLFIVLRVLKAILPKMQGGGKDGAGALVLHSESIGDKQRIVLLDLHGQLVAVGVSGGAISPLATIDQPDAMESLRARYSSIPQAVPGYRESTKQPAIGQSFAEALKRAGIVGQRQTGAPPAPRVALTIPFLQRAAANREPGKVKAAASPPIRNPRRRAAGQSAPEPVLLDALEAMRSLRRTVESS